MLLSSIKSPKKNDSIPGHEIKNEYILIHFPCKTYEKKKYFSSSDFLICIHFSFRGLYGRMHIIKLAKRKTTALKKNNIKNDRPKK